MLTSILVKMTVNLHYDLISEPDFIEDNTDENSHIAVITFDDDDETIIDSDDESFLIVHDVLLDVELSKIQIHYS